MEKTVPLISPHVAGVAIRRNRKFGVSQTSFCWLPGVRKADLNGHVVLWFANINECIGV
jgi:hypothetical protein